MNKRENAGLKHLNSSKVFLENLNHMDYIRKNIEQCNLHKKRKMLIVFDDMIADMFSN